MTLPAGRVDIPVEEGWVDQSVVDFGRARNAVVEDSVVSSEAGSLQCRCSEASGT